MPYRTRQQMPWYHQPKQRCGTTTQAGTQCLASASYRAEGNDLHGFPCCKPHGDMLALEGYRVRKIPAPRKVDLASRGRRHLSVAV